MHNCVLPVNNHTQKDKSLAICCMEVQDLSDGFFQFDLVTATEDHSIAEWAVRLGIVSKVEEGTQRQKLLIKGGIFIAQWLLQISFKAVNMSDFEYLLKFIVVGDTGVGKSCVVNQFIQQKINENHQITLGVEFASRSILLGTKTLKLQVWDTAGQENFRSITRSYYRSAIGALLIYDITRKRSFQHLQEWIREIKNNGSDQLQILLIGNKNDLESQREVEAAEGRKFAEDNNIQWLEINAKEYEKVENAFLKLAKLIVTRIERGEITELTPGVKIGRSSKIDPLADFGGPKKKYCC